MAFAATLLALGVVAAATISLGDARYVGAEATQPSETADDCPVDPATPKRQLRAMWISSVVNIDWPSATGLDEATQKSEFIGWLDVAKQRNLNAVVVQIRPTADAFWPSPYEPWSEWLTGTPGGDPGYDPLAFMVDEAHKRGLEFHAWFNPYRVSMQADRNHLAPNHPVRQHPEWAFEYGDRLYYDPGIPEVRQFVEDAMLDAVERYDVDGVHLDDYFYPYPVDGESIPDEDTYAEHGDGFDNIDDWRRSNVNLLVQELDARIHDVKPWVKFGISPFGIWRNKSTDPLGSDTNGLQSYDEIYADSRLWVTNGWVDYITPQIYWYIGFDVADYSVLMNWWADVAAGASQPVQLYVGQAAYRTGEDPNWDADELSSHLFENRNRPEVSGDIYFSAKDVRADALGAVSKVVADHYQRPALAPQYDGAGAAPPAPAITDAIRTADGVELTFTGSGDPAPTSYAVYRLDGDVAGEPCDFADASNLVGVATASADGSGGSFLDTTAGDQTYSYFVSALDRTWHESDVSAPAVVEGDGDGGEPWTTTIDNATAGGFTASGEWGTSSWSSQRYDGDYRYANPVAASDPAWFAADIPTAGSYQVDAWYPSDPGYNSATPFIVAASGGNQMVTVDQRSGGGQWVSLGTFTLHAGAHDVVGVSRWTSVSGYVVADAVRITRSS